MTRRIALAMALASLFALSSLSPALAFEPNRQSNELSDWTGPQHPIAPGQGAMANLKVAVDSGDVTAASTAARAAGVQISALAAATTQYLVGTWERRQTTSYYCGPTAVQVEADYVWNMGASTVKWTQKQISDKWTHTGTAGTGAAAELVGANGVLVGSPKSAWPYWSEKPTSGADWSDKLKTDTVLAMPQLVNLQPWWQNSSGTWYYLPDWSGHRSTGGHWITANGWENAWDGTSGPRVRYDDGSGDYGGGTGTYWAAQSHMWLLIYHHNDIVIW